MTKRWLRHIIVTAALIACLMAWRIWFPGQPFDSLQWHADANVRSGVRQRMADRLIARGSLIGLTRNEAVALLGEPPETGYFTDWDLVYLLGDERGFISIDSEWLVLRLGPNGRIAQAKLVTD